MLYALASKQMQPLTFTVSCQANYKLLSKRGGAGAESQTFVPLGSKSVDTELKAIYENWGSKSPQYLHGSERRVRARGLTDCSIRKPITSGWTNLPWCFINSLAFLILFWHRTDLFLPPDFVSGSCGRAPPLLMFLNTVSYCCCPGIKYVRY